MEADQSGSGRAREYRSGSQPGTRQPTLGSQLVKHRDYTHDRMVPSVNPVYNNQVFGLRLARLIVVPPLGILRDVRRAETPA